MARWSRTVSAPWKSLLEKRAPVSPITWEITEGAFVVAEPATFEFRVTDTTSNHVLNSNTGSAAFNGTLNINTSAVTLTTGNTWPLIDVTGLGATFGTNFAVAGFDDSNNDGVWTKSDSLGDWSFSETSGELILDVGSDYDTWGGPYGLAAGSEGGDLDDDGLTNFEEYAFGLIPNSGASVNPITVPLNKTAGTFSYTRRATPATTGLSYKVWYSTTLEAGSWIEDSGASEGTAALNGEVETVPVTLSSGLLTNPKLFIQVRAE